MNMKNSDINQTRPITIRNAGSVELPGVSEEEVRKSLKDIKKNKSLCEDELTTNMLIEEGDKLIRLVPMLMNDCR